MHPTSIFIGTVLLEANRWAPQRTPTYQVSEWIARFAAAGFDGIELWENHAALASDQERTALRKSALPVAVFNSYATLDDASAPQRQRSTELGREFHAPAMKFNFGAELVGVKCELRNARAWAAAMPGVRLLCECHPGTALEKPAAAARVLAAWPEAGVIVHPLLTLELPGWMKLLGARVAHAHMQYVDAEWRRWRLRDRATLCRERLRILRDGGFAGSFTIEFTAGVGTTPEDRDSLFAAAADDLAFLREEW